MRKLHAALAGFALAAFLTLAQAAVDAIGDTEESVARLYRIEMESSCWSRPIPDAEIDALVERVVRRYKIRTLVVIARSQPPNTGLTIHLDREPEVPSIFIVNLPEADPVSRWLVLHEVSHVIATSRYGGDQGHGDRFRKILADLVGEYVDAECAVDFRRRLADPKA